jgi:5-methylcytosine-specific restriction endonuclease McrA
MDTLIEKKCEFCENTFLAKAKESTRGGARFCSRSCSGSHSNKIRPYVDLLCKKCGKSFSTKCKQALYCSKECSYRKSTSYRYRNHLNAKIKKIISTSICFNCGWDKTTCDVHHVIPRKKGGTDELHNLIIVCPNCHRLADRHLLNLTTIPTVANKTLNT